MRSDERTENTRNPNIDFKGFVYKNYKDIIAFFLIIFCLLILVLSKKENLSETVSTLLISVVSGSMGFIFGKKVT